MVVNLKLSGYAAIFVLCIVIMLNVYLYLTIEENAKFKKQLLVGLNEGYLINYPKCRIPALNPFDGSIYRFFHPEEEPASCSPHPPLTEVVYSTSTKEHRLELVRDAVPHYYKDREVNCCVTLFEESVSYIEQKDCTDFNGSWRIDERQCLGVFCYNTEERVVYKNLHTAVVWTYGTKRKRKYNSDSFNVLLIGIDSLSKLNLYRTMPLTVKYLQTRGWLEMSGYNKIADDTLPNLMAVLTGMAPGQYSNSHSANYDYLPFIWSDFSSAGYVTAYAEDKPYIGTFTSISNKFSVSPTDYYPLNYFLIGERLFMTRMKGRECVGYKTPSDHLFDYLLDYVTVYRDYNFFGFFWTNYLSHNVYNLPRSYDSRVLNLLKDLESLGTLNNTMVMFLSDHGLRVGETRKTRVGWFEDRMPFLFISLPDWYKSKYATRYRNMVDNTHMLTSPYDVYVTLNQIVRKDKYSEAIGCDTCYSLFNRIPQEKRDCANAGIAPHWCTCHDVINQPTDSNITRMAELVVMIINSQIQMDKDVEIHYRCANLTLAKVLYSRRKAAPSDDQYVLGVQTDPGRSEFEATVIKKGRQFTVDDFISRINEYRGDSHCARNHDLREMCYCVQNES